MAVRLKVWGNQETMNLPSIILENIKQNAYFRDLYVYKTYNEVLQEIEREVRHLEPWIPKTRTPSTSFCLLYKLFTLRVTEKQMVGMLDSQNEFVRGIGFLYLRFCYDPAGMLEWFYDYLEDQTPIQPNERGKEIPLWTFLIQLLVEPKYHDLMLPRIPVPVMRQWKPDLEPIAQRAGLSFDERKSTGGSNRAPMSMRRMYAAPRPDYGSSLGIEDKSDRKKRPRRGDGVTSRRDGDHTTDPRRSSVESDRWNDRPHSRERSTSRDRDRVRGHRDDDRSYSRHHRDERDPDSSRDRRDRTRESYGRHRDVRDERDPAYREERKHRDERRSRDDRRSRDGEHHRSRDERDGKHHRSRDERDGEHHRHRRDADGREEADQRDGSQPSAERSKSPMDVDALRARYQKQPGAGHAIASLSREKQQETDGETVVVL